MHRVKMMLMMAGGLPRWHDIGEALGMVRMRSGSDKGGVSDGGKARQQRRDEVEVAWESYQGL